MQALFDALAASATFWLIVSVAVLVAVAVSVAFARPPRWLRARRRLDDMFAAARAEQVLAERAQHKAGQS